MSSGGRGDRRRGPEDGVWPEWAGGGSWEVPRGSGGEGSLSVGGSRCPSWPVAYRCQGVRGSGR